MAGDTFSKSDFGRSRLSADDRIASGAMRKGISYHPVLSNLTLIVDLQTSPPTSKVIAKILDIC